MGSATGILASGAVGEEHCPQKLDRPYAYRNRSALGVRGCYDSIPDFTNIVSPTDMLDRTLGIYNLPICPIRVTLEDVRRRVRQNGNETAVEYHTPVGSIRTASMFTEEMLDAGAFTAWISQHAIREPQDFEVVGHIFSHLKVEPSFDGYMARRRKWANKACRGIYSRRREPHPTHHERTDGAGGFLLRAS